MNSEQAGQKVKRIVRLLATDIDGNLPLERALRKIKGISFMFSKAICNLSGIDPKMKIGLLGEDELKKVENLINNPTFPKWLLNRRRDLETGRDIHLVGSKLDFKKREDIDMLRKMRAYRGVRHQFGLPVRGQRTRTSFRTHKSVGVRRKEARKPAAERK